MLGARMGFSPQAYQPRDPLNPGATPTGSASDPTGAGAYMSNAVANYKPGDGGVSTDVIDSVMHGMGYGAGKKFLIDQKMGNMPHSLLSQNATQPDEFDLATKKGLPTDLASKKRELDRRLRSGV